MSDIVQLIVLDRENPSQNMARYYVLSVEATLFGDVALVREWGRLGRQGCRRLDLYRDNAEVVEALETWLGRKMRRGYKVRCIVDQPGFSSIERARNPRSADIA